MARVKNQSARRALLIQATSDAVLARGAAGLRLNDIAAEAGLAPSSVLYYYPDVRELYTAVLAQGGEQYCVRREESVAAYHEPGDRLAACIRSGTSRPGAAADTSRILYELAPIVLRVPEAAKEYESLIARQTALYEQVLRDCESSGRFTLRMPAHVLARSFVALEDGYGIDVLTGAISADEEEELLLRYAEIVVEKKA